MEGPVRRRDLVDADHQQIKALAGFRGNGISALSSLARVVISTSSGF